MATISLNGIEIYGYHGVLQEENVLGTPYRINLKVKVDLKKAMISDDLESTINYADLYNIVKEEMAIKSKLIEAVAHRILDRILNEHSLVLKATVAVSKIHPPIEGHVKSATVKLNRKRK
jgi:dihydroneopterin aldolase